MTKNRIASLLEDLCSLGWDVQLLARPTPPQSFLTAPVPTGVDVCAACAFKPHTCLRGWLGLGPALYHADAALVFMPTVRTALVACFLARRAVVYAGISWKGLGARGWRLALEELVARRAFHLVAAGDDVAARFTEHARAVSLATPLVPPEVVERLTQRSPSVKDRSAVRALFVGSIGTRKGVEELLRALEMTPQVEACIVGPIDDAALGRRVQEVARSGRLSLQPYLEWEDLRRAYEWANLLVLPSHSEGFPRVVYEATAFGNALVVTPVGGIPSRLQDGVSAVFVPPRNAAALAAVLRMLAREPHRLRSLAEAAQEALRPVFAAPGGGAQFDVLLRRVLHRASDTPRSGRA